MNKDYTMANVVYLTQEGLQKVREELDHLMGRGASGRAGTDSRGAG